MRRSHRTRAAAALLALLMQGAGLALLIEHRTAPDTAPALAWIDLQMQPLIPLPQPPPPSRRATPAPRTPAASPEPSRPLTATPPDAILQRPLPHTAPQPERAITLSAADWYAAATSAGAQHGAELEARNAGRGDPLDGKPAVLELPKPPPEPFPRVQRLENGDIQVRARNGSVCTHEQLSLAEHFSPWAKGRPARCTLPARDDSGLGERFDALKPRHLRGELPLPREGAKKVYEEDGSDPDE